MSKSSLESAVRHVRSLVAGQNFSDLSDGQLLRAFVARDDQAAFAALAQRRGPLVLGVCRRVLHQLQDAEDVFQATFIVLARQAAALAHKETLSGWLHRVSYRIALNARRAAVRRRKHERESPTINPANPAWEAAWREVQLLLDEEVQRLPEKYREPFVLCCLENQSCPEAASRLGVKEGTVWSRLAEARKRLQKRLSRRGVELTAVLGAAVLTPKPTMAAALVAKAVSAAASTMLPAGRVAVLVKGMTTSLLLKQAKIGVALFLTVSALVGVTGMGAYQSSLTEHTNPALETQPPAVKDQEGGATKKERAVATDPAPRLDTNGDPLPPGAVNRIGSVGLRHGGAVLGAVFTPDGKALASASGDGYLRLWDPTSGKLRWRVGIDNEFRNAFAFSGDGKKLAVLSDFEFVMLELKTGKKINRHVWPHDEGSDRVVGLAIAPDLGTFARGRFDGTVRIYDAVTGNEKVLIVVGEEGSFPCATEFSADGKQFYVLANRKAGVLVFDLNTGKPAPTLEIPKAFPQTPYHWQFGLATSQNGSLLAAVDENRVVLWDLAAGKQRHFVETKRREVALRPGQMLKPRSMWYCGAFSPDNSWRHGNRYRDFRDRHTSRTEAPARGSRHAFVAEGVHIFPGVHARRQVTRCRGPLWEHHAVGCRHKQARASFERSQIRAKHSFHEQRQGDSLLWR